MNFLDTAAMYGKGASERRVGELTGAKTWWWRRSSRLATSPVRAAFPGLSTRACTRLQRTQVDLYQIHYPFPWMSIPKLMNLMADAVQAGKIRAVGVSNYNAKQMRTAHTELAKRGLPLASNQVQYSLLRRDPETNGVLDACRELGITLIAYMPLAAGALTGKYSATSRPVGWRQYMRYFRGKNLAVLSDLLDLMREIGGRYGMGPSQVALRWLMQQDGVLPIVGAKNAGQARQNAGALGFELDDDEVDALDRATAPGSKGH